MIEIMGKPNDNPEDVMEFIKSLPDREQESALRAAVAMGRIEEMINRTCKNCIENDFGICDRLGRQVKGDDACHLHKINWRENLLQRFLSVK